MPDSFEFTVSTPRIELPAARTGEAMFDVTSRLGRHGRVGVEIKPSDAADASWFGPIDPPEFDLADAATTKVAVPIHVPTSVAAGEHQLTIRAYAIDNPQVDFTQSPSVAIVVAAVEPKKGPPLWLLILIAVIVLGVLGFAAKKLFFDGDDPPTVPPGSVTDLVGLTMAEATSSMASADGATLVEFTNGTVTKGSGCVFAQTPKAGTALGAAGQDGAATTTVAVFTVECPTPSPSVPPPAGTDRMCDAAFGFCQALARVYGDDFSTSEAWLTDSADMFTTFLDTFTIPGTAIPSVIGLPEFDAVNTITSNSFAAPIVESADQFGGSRCVLLQYPFPDVMAASTTKVVLVTAPCPPKANSADQVNISTDLAGDYNNLCVVAPQMCGAVDTDPSAAENGVGTPAFNQQLDNMVLAFRNAFIGDLVPDVVGMSLESAISTLATKSLGAEYVKPFTEGEVGLYCFTVVSQTPAASTDITTLGSNIVQLQLEADVCWFLNPDLILVEAIDVFTVVTVGP